jgi:hypothetical protein
MIQQNYIIYNSVPKLSKHIVAVPKLSKHLVTHMEGLLAVSPYVNGPFDSRDMGVAEAVAAAALLDLNKLANEPYMPTSSTSSKNASARPQDSGASNPRSMRSNPRKPPTTLRKQQRPTPPLVEATAVGW